MTSPAQQPTPPTSPADVTAADSASATTHSGAAKANGTQGSNGGTPHGGNGGNGGGNGGSAAPGAAQLIHVDSFVRTPAKGAHRLSTQPGSGWPAAPAVALSFGSLTAGTPGASAARPLVQGGMAARSHFAASTEPQRHLARSDATADVALEDWHDLLSAVMERLRLTVAESMGTLPQPHMQVVHGAARLQATVLECVLALDQLQGTLAHEFNRREGLECETQAAHAALLRAFNEQAQSQSEQRLLHEQAPRDSPAPLPNRGVFSKHLERALACAAPQARPAALLVINVDGCKEINAEHGRSVGDEMLGVVGARLARAVRAEDIVSRVGSDEFACLIRGPASTAQLAQLASKLVGVVTMPCVLGALQLRVRPSIGIACCPGDGDTAAELMAGADAAMLRARRAKSRFALFSQPDSV